MAAFLRRWKLQVASATIHYILLFDASSPWLLHIILSYLLTCSLSMSSLSFGAVSLFNASLNQYDVILIAKIMNFWTWKGSVWNTCDHKLQQLSNTINIYPFNPSGSRASCWHGNGLWHQWGCRRAIGRYWLELKFFATGHWSVDSTDLRWAPRSDDSWRQRRIKRRPHPSASTKQDHFLENGMGHPNTGNGSCYMFDNFLSWCWKLRQSYMLLSILNFHMFTQKQTIMTDYIPKRSPCQCTNVVMDLSFQSTLPTCSVRVGHFGILSCEEIQIYHTQYPSTSKKWDEKVIKRTSPKVLRSSFAWTRQSMICAKVSDKSGNYRSQNFQSKSQWSYGGTSTPQPLTYTWKITQGTNCHLFRQCSFGIFWPWPMRHAIA